MDSAALLPWKKKETGEEGIWVFSLGWAPPRRRGQQDVAGAAAGEEALPALRDACAVAVEEEDWNRPLCSVAEQNG